MAAKFLTGIDVDNQRILAVASPSAATDGVNKAYVDALIEGLKWKDAVRAATTTAGTLASSFEAGDTIDSVVVLAAFDRILIKDQADPRENGIYIVASSGAPTRSPDANTGAELNSATVFISSGTVNADKSYTQSTDNPVIGVSNLVWVITGGVTYLADGLGIELVGTTFSLELDGPGLVKSGTGLKVDATVVSRKFSVDCAAATSTVVTHNLGTKDVAVSLREVATDKLNLDADTVATSTTTVTVTFASAPTAGQYRITVQG